jgi:hypothetical protein
MSDEFEDLLKRWLRDRGTNDRSTIRALAGNVAALPPRRRRQPAHLAVAAAVIVALGLAAFTLIPRQSSISATASAPPVAPDPAAFAGDPRLARCGATVATAIDVFEMTHARDYRLHLPAMGLSPELDVDTPGFVVVYRDMHPGPEFGAFGGPSQPPRSLPPGHHDICVLVGTDPQTAELNVYDDVDVTGLTAVVVSVAPSPSGPYESTEPFVLPTTAGLTPEPAPAWAGDATVSLDCVGPPSVIGPTGSMDIGSSVYSSDAALSDFLDFVQTAGLAFPAAGFRQADAVTGARLYTDVVAGRVKAVVVVNAEGGTEAGRWFAGSVASCDPSEFDTTRDFGQKVTIWLDSAGRAVSTSVLYERSDCYQATKLTFKDHLYVRDPTGFGYEQANLEATYDGNVPLPASAVRQPYADGQRRLYLAKDGRAAYVVEGKSVERWPHVTGDEYVRMDCN